MRQRTLSGDNYAPASPFRETPRPPRRAVRRADAALFDIRQCSLRCFEGGDAP